MAGILVYALHDDEGNFNKNSLGAISEAAKLVVERPILQDSEIADVGYVAEPGIIIGRLNAFDANESGGSAEVVVVDVELSEWSSKAKLVQRGEQRGADVNIEDADILVGGGPGL